MKTIASIIILLGVMPAANCCAAIWSVNASGDWLEDSNWDTGVAPNSDDAEAIFDDSIINSNRTVFANDPVSVHRLEFDSDPKYVLAGLGTIQFDKPTVSSANAEISVLQGRHELQLPAKLNTNIDLDLDVETALAINGTLNLNGHSLSKGGAGTVILNSAKTTENGGTLNLAEGVLAGAGAIDGDLLQSGGELQVGNIDQQDNVLFGTFKVYGTYSQSAMGMLRIDLGTKSYDVVSGGAASLNGRLMVSLVDFAPQFGDRFKILDFTSLAANFSQVLLPDVSQLPAVVLRDCGELMTQWDCSQLQSDGVIVYVPEPEFLVLPLLLQLFLVSSGRCRP